MVKSILVSAILLSFPHVFAAPSEPFSEQKFSEYVQSGSPFVVAFHSDSCGSCKVQKPSLESALNEKPLENVHGLMANFDETSEFRKHLKKPVRGPSTILVFNGGKEIARIQGETRKEKIQQLISENIKTN